MKLSKPFIIELSQEVTVRYARLLAATAKAFTEEGASIAKLIPAMSLSQGFGSFTESQIHGGCFIFTAKYQLEELAGTIQLLSFDNGFSVFVEADSPLVAHARTLNSMREAIEWQDREICAIEQRIGA